MNVPDVTQFVKINTRHRHSWMDQLTLGSPIVMRSLITFLSRAGVFDRRRRSPWPQGLQYSRKLPVPATHS